MARNICPICLTDLPISEMCSWHSQDDDSKAQSAHARIMAGIIHRGVIPKRLPKDERPLEEEAP